MKITHQCTNRGCIRNGIILDRWGRYWCEDCYELYVEANGD